MNKKDLLALVTNLAQDAHGYESDDIATAQENALNYYFMRPRGDEIAGRSQAVSGDLSAMTEANLASMIEAFTTDRIVEFQPDGAADESQAQLESDVVSDFVMERNNGYLTFVACIKDALLMRNGIAKVWVEERTRTTTREYGNVTPDSIAGLLAQPHSEIIDEGDGYVKVRATVAGMRLRVDAIPIENFLYTKNWTSLDLSDVPFCAERHLDLRSALRDRGFSRTVVDRLPAHQQHTTARTARNPKNAEETQNKTSDSSLDLIEWFEAYVLADTDGDGIAERRKICFVENHAILSNVPFSYVPYAAGAAILNPHRFLGISLFDKLKQVQDINTGLTRSLLDNANVSNKSRTAYLLGKVNEDDLDNGLVDGNIRVSGVESVQQALMAFEQPDISAGILANIQQFERRRSELGGAALDLSQANLQLSDRAGSQGIDRAYSVMEQTSALMTRLIAQSLIRNVYLLAHATLREYFDMPVSIRRNGQWLETIPSRWPERSRLTVKIGMSPGERRRKIDALSAIVESQFKLLQSGYDDILVNADGFYAAVMDWSRAQEVANPEQYYINPQTPESQQAVKQKETAQQMQQQAQQKLMDVALSLEQLRIALDKREKDADRVVDVFKALLEAETKEAGIVGKATAEMQIAQLNRNAEDVANKQDSEDLSRVEKAINALREITNTQRAD